MDGFTVRSGPSEVIATGTVISFSGNPVQFEFPLPDDRLRVILVIKQLEQQPENAFSGEVIDPKTLQITISTVGGALGGGTMSPVPIGSLNGRPLSVHFRLYTIKDSDTTIHYTFYLGEAEEKK